jgi:hypothetical protein
MTKEESLAALLAERYGQPVKPYKPKTRVVIAELLDVLRDAEDDENVRLLIEKRAS